MSWRLAVGVGISSGDDEEQNKLAAFESFSNAGIGRMGLSINATVPHLPLLAYGRTPDGVKNAIGYKSHLVLASEEYVSVQSASMIILEAVDGKWPHL